MLAHRGSKGNAGHRIGGLSSRIANSSSRSPCRSSEGPADHWRSGFAVLADVANSPVWLNVFAVCRRPVAPCARWCAKSHPEHPLLRLPTCRSRLWGTSLGGRIAQKPRPASQPRRRTRPKMKGPVSSRPRCTANASSITARRSGDHSLNICSFALRFAVLPEAHAISSSISPSHMRSRTSTDRRTHR